MKNIKNWDLLDWIVISMTLIGLFITWFAVIINIKN